MNAKHSKYVHYDLFLYFKQGDDLHNHLDLHTDKPLEAMAEWLSNLEVATTRLQALISEIKDKNVNIDAGTHMIRISTNDPEVISQIEAFSAENGLLTKDEDDDEGDDLLTITISYDGDVDVALEEKLDALAARFNGVRLNALMDDEDDSDNENEMRDVEYEFEDIETDGEGFINAVKSEGIMSSRTWGIISPMMD